MPKPRYTQVSLEATPYYHCVSRCVRRAFLCGTDANTGQSFEHRRQWIEDKLLDIGQHFAIDICAYAIMSNHYHVVLYIDKEQADNWNRDDVIDHWHRLFSGNLISQRYAKNESLSKVELKVLDECVSTWRERLMDISWFMRVLNERIAREANAEDNCTGRFWEGRFKSQTLLDEAALATCMAYVDLNPIRAKMDNTPETSDHTSIKQRIEKAQHVNHPNHLKQQVRELMPFAGNPRKHMPKGLPFQLTDYLELVDWSGRIIRTNKRGAIAEDTPPILQRLNIDPEHWIYLTQHYESSFKGLVGSVYKLRQTCVALGYERTPGLRGCEQFFP
jgi:REP element-mobilizing transposase RayT